mmetsp:Transcript_11495/g.34688  ORF Transcript_11495/g.34688 Transcript_11495/m.34688 type:complete len:88 (+) Transcript_11495:25-288(+)
MHTSPPRTAQLLFQFKKAPLWPPPGAGVAGGSAASFGGACAARALASRDGLHVWSTRVLPGIVPMSFNGMSCKARWLLDGTCAGGWL